MTVTFLTAVCILLPLWLTRDRVNLAGAGPLFAFFVAIGLGFMLIETSQMQRLIIALGHPDVRAVGRAVRAAAVERDRQLPDERRDRGDGAARSAVAACWRVVVVLAVFGAADAGRSCAGSSR